MVKAIETVEATMSNLLKHELFSRRYAILGWGVGMALFEMMYLSIIPEMGEQMKTLADLPLYEKMGIDMGSFEGFIASSVIGTLTLMLGIYAIMTSTETLAGEEDRGTLELIVATPLSRWRIVSAKAAAVSVAALLILAIAGVPSAFVLRAIKTSVEIDVTPVQLFWATLSVWPLTVTLLMLGLFLGAYLPNRRTAALVVTVVFIASYLGEMLTGFVQSLDFAKPLSLFYYFDSTAAMFSQGAQPRDLAVLFGLAALFFVLALLSFQRRDITVGAWPWQRAR